jgi:hypothetical protein
MLEMNQYFLVKAYQYQNNDSIEDSIKCLEKIHRNFHTLGNIADQFPNTPVVIRENREILSQYHLDKLNEKFPLMNPTYENDKAHSNSNNKPKQLKKKWTEKEQILYLEAMELYGPKST